MLSYLLFRGTCVLCKSSTKRRFDLCRHCLDDLPRTGVVCPVCALPLPTSGVCGPCRIQPPPFNRTICAFSYDFPVNHMINAFKRGNHLYGRVLSEALGMQPATRNCGELDLLIPVPLSKRRAKERGFNQAEEIAKWLAKSIHAPIERNLCLRIRDSVDQKKLGASGRKRNLRGAFQATGRFDSLNVGLIDDVVTTMATVEEVSKTLKEAGAMSVTVLSLARTPARRSTD